jgi:hypothetical protein
MERDTPSFLLEPETGASLSTGIVSSGVPLELVQPGSDINVNNTAMNGTISPYFLIISLPFLSVKYPVFCLKSVRG